LEALVALYLELEELNLQAILGQQVLLDYGGALAVAAALALLATRALSIIRLELVAMEAVEGGHRLQ
jgi:hypothetical protein